MTTKAFSKHGPKYQAKIDEADAEWEQQAQAIEAGQRQSMWSLLEERGYVKDVAGGSPAEIEQLLTRKRIGAYVGIDPTAPSLHVGHLLPLMPLFWMYMHGFRAVTLIGSATGKIGDPTDRLVSRDAATTSSATVSMNMVKMHYQVKKLWENVDDQARRFGYRRTWAWRRGLLQNGHWWNKLPLLEVLKRLGSGVRIGPMLSRDTVRRKMSEGDGMSFAEFTYPLMQAWDWWHMYHTQGVQMQIGGSDQYGNIVAGVDGVKTIRASEPNPPLRLPAGGLHDPVGFTVPLLTDSSGAKFGKSAGNAIWLDRFQTSSFDLYGYFVRRPDADVERLLRLFTFLPMDAIRQLMAEHAADPSQRVPHHALAYEIVTLVHGSSVADETREQHRAMYQKGPAATETAATAETAETAAGPAACNENPHLTLNNAPQVDMQLPASLFAQGRVARILYAAEMVRSVSEGNRLAVQKGAYVGAAPGRSAKHNPGMLLSQLSFTPVHLWHPEDTKNFILDGKYMVLRRGRHNVRVIEIVSDEEWERSGRTYPGQPYTGRVRVLRQKLDKLREKRLRAAEDAEEEAAEEAEMARIEGELVEAEREEAKMEKKTPDAATPPQLIFPEKESPRVQELEQEIQEELDQRKK